MPDCPHPPHRQSEQPYMDGTWIVCQCGKRLRFVKPPSTRSQAEADVEKAAAKTIEAGRLTWEGPPK